MECYILTGGDDWALRARRAALLDQLDAAPQNVERFDLSVDGGAALVTAASAFSLFGGHRVLDAEPADALLAVHAAALAGATDVTVVLRGPSPVPAAVLKALPGKPIVEKFPIPHGRGVITRIDELAARSGVSLSRACRDLLLERGGHDLPRVASVMSQLVSIGLLEPTPTHLAAMLGTSAAPGVPWALADMLESGDVPGALQLAATLEPVAVVNYLASRTGQVGHVVDEQLVDADAIAGAFGMASRFPAVKLAKLAARLGPRGVCASWDLISAADRSVKVSPDPRAALDLLVVRLAQLWGGRPAQLAASPLGHQAS